MKRNHILIFLLMATLSGFSQQPKVELFDQSGITISEVSINTTESDFGASVVGNTLFFSSVKERRGKIYAKKRKSHKFYGIYQAGINHNGDPFEGRKNVEEFCTSYHDGLVSSWCAKTEELFLTQTNKSQVRYNLFPTEYNNLKISTAKRKGLKWEVVEEFPFNNAGYSVAHPAINKMGDTLVFASDMPGGFGQADLYLSVRKNGRWEIPVNLGSRVNTAGKEEFPFLFRNKDGQTCLVFTSDRSEGMGGLDIYYTNLNDRNSDVKLFDSPVNSLNDDFAFSFFPDKGFGYFSSNRKGMGDDDIYKFTFNTPPAFTQKVYNNSSGVINLSEIK